MKLDKSGLTVKGHGKVDYEVKLGNVTDLLNAEIGKDSMNDSWLRTGADRTNGDYFNEPIVGIFASFEW